MVSGIHTCLVFIAFGPDVATAMVDFKHQFKRDTLWSLPTWVAKRIAFQTLSGLEYLHELGICHSGMLVAPYLLTSVPITDLILDVQPGNILIDVPDLDTLDEAALQAQSEKPITSNAVTRLDG